MINLKFSNNKEPFYDVTIDNYGNIRYYNKEGQLHRLNGPAIECPTGRIEYWINNKLHRLDGPAVIWSDGSVEYWINGKPLTKKEFDELTKENNND